MKIRGIFPMNIMRWLQSWELILSILGIVILCLCGSYSAIDINNTVVNIFSVLLDLNNFNKLVIFLAAISFGTCFCQDWNSGFIRLIVSKTGLMKYTSAVYFVGCFSAYLTVMIGLGIYVVIVSFIVPAYVSELDCSYVILGGVYGELLSKGHIWLYFLCRIHFIAMEAALCTGLGITVSALLPDSFTAITFPFVIKYVLDVLTDKMPVALNFGKLAKAYPIWNTNCTVNILYVLCIFSAVLVIGYFIFNYYVGRRVENELC